MESEMENATRAADETGWSLPQPATIPRPTYAPAGIGLGITLIFWGLATTGYISGVGLLLFLFALMRWLGELHRGS